MTLFRRACALMTAAMLCALMGCSGTDGASTSMETSSAPSVITHAPSYDTSSYYSAPSSTFSSAYSAYSSYIPPRVSSVAPSRPSTSSTVTSSNLPAYLQEIINDMKLPHEGNPHGVPSSYNWARSPRVGMGINMPEGWNAATAWGQVYEAAEGNPATNTRVQLRNMRMYYFSKSQQKWITLQSTTSVSGGAYTENFAGNANRPADTRNESGNGGGISVTAGDGYNYHFWPTGQRVTLDRNDIAAIYSTCQARLIVGDKSKPDDRDSARYLLSVGGDYWYNTSIGWAEFKTNGDWAIGRFKYVKKEWRSFSGWAGDESILRKNPPPQG